MIVNSEIGVNNIVGESGLTVRGRKLWWQDHGVIGSFENRINTVCCFEV
jgi:hypothetical protein